MKSNARYKVGLIGSGSWATAIAKILADNNFRIHWQLRNEEDAGRFRLLHHNPRYLSTVNFDLRKLTFHTDAAAVIEMADWIVICMPSAFLKEWLHPLPRDIFSGKSVVSGVKGILPGENLLLNDYLLQEFGLPLQQYFSITGPCHAEEVAAEKLSYITFSGKDLRTTRRVAGRFTTRYLKTVVNNDIRGAQYAAVLKNIYAIGAGIAHGLGYGDNFLSVYIANCAQEMTIFTEAVCGPGSQGQGSRNAFASAYLGDLLVTCYSQYSRNRTFGNMIGKGYTVRAAQLELSMIAEGYYAARCIHEVNKKAGASVPILESIYRILWESFPSREGFKHLEQLFV